jgi:hypothetical protein
MTDLQMASSVSYVDVCSVAKDGFWADRGDAHAPIRPLLVSESSWLVAEGSSLVPPGIIVRELLGVARRVARSCDETEARRHE